MVICRKAAIHLKYLTVRERRRSVSERSKRERERGREKGEKRERERRMKGGEDEKDETLRGLIFFPT